VEVKLPTCTAEEIDGYVRDTANNHNHGEEPLKVKTTRPTPCATSWRRWT